MDVFVEERTRLLLMCDRNCSFEFLQDLRPGSRFGYIFQGALKISVIEDH